MSLKEQALLNIRNNVKSLARRQYPESATEQLRYENVLLWEKFGELFHRSPELLALPVVDEPPKVQTAEVIDIASKTVLHD